jgi:hypothetical protein
MFLRTIMQTDENQPVIETPEEVVEDSPVEETQSLPPVDLSLLLDDLMPVSKKPTPVQGWRSGETDNAADVEADDSIPTLLNDLFDEVEEQGKDTRLMILGLASKVNSLIAVLKEAGTMGGSDKDVEDLKIVNEVQRQFIQRIMTTKTLPDAVRADIGRELASMSAARDYQEADARLRARAKQRAAIS